jgi:hypothetical protein
MKNKKTFGSKTKIDGSEVSTIRRGVRDNEGTQSVGVDLVARSRAENTTQGGQTESLGTFRVTTNKPVN